MDRRKGISNDKRIPGYYKVQPIYVEDVIDYVESIGDMRGFCRGNIIKYIVRAGKKGKTLEDLYKARDYINRWILSEEKDNDSNNNSDGRFLGDVDNDRLNAFLNDNFDGRGIIK